MPSSQDSITDFDDIGSGSHSIAGYEYQIDVSVWLALDLILDNQFTQELTLEPASEEDVEGDLNVDEPGRVNGTVSLEGYTLVCQAKLRTGDAWAVADVKRLLLHGGKKRVSAATRLKNPKIRYLLVTSAGLNGLTKGLGRKKPGLWPDAKDMPTEIVNAVGQSAAGRVAIIGGADDDWLETQIRNLLTDSFRVPNALWKDCWKKLHEEARLRVRGAAKGKWTRKDLETVIREYEGYVASSPELEHYVPPTNWSDLIARVERDHAVLITGQSGTGKTLASRKLFDVLSDRIPGLRRVPITHGPSQISSDTNPPPVFFDIEDPWGKYKFDRNSYPWNETIAGLFKSARASRIIVATSRLDVARTADILEDVEPWTFSLEAEHYGLDQKKRLYQNRIRSLPRDLQEAARDSWKTVLDRLATPYEIQKFFDAMTTASRDTKRYPNLITDCIARAHRDSIERTVIEQIVARKELQSAAVIWGLLTIGDKLSLDMLRNIEDELAERNSALDESPQRLVSFFVAARNLRQNGKFVSYYHPRVEAGIRRALTENSMPARKALKSLVATLIAHDQNNSQGVEMASKLVATVAQNADLKFSPAKDDQAKLDAFLPRLLVSTSYKLDESLRIAASAGSDASNTAELARHLMHRPDKRFGFFQNWKPIRHSKDWYDRIRSDPTTKSVLERFIIEVLPETRDRYGVALAIELTKLSDGLTPAFIQAALATVDEGHEFASSTIAAGAVADLDGFEAVVDAASAVAERVWQGDASWRETALRITNEEFSDDYADHLSESDEGYTADSYLRAFVEEARAKGDWRRVANHRHIKHLARQWLRALLEEEANPSPAELIQLHQVVGNTDQEDEFWRVARLHWSDDLRAFILARLIAGHPSADVRSSATACWALRVSQNFAEVTTLLQNSGNTDRLCELAIDLGRTQSGFWTRSDGDVAVLNASQASLPAPWSEIANARSSKEPIQLSDAAIMALQQSGLIDETLATFRVQVASSSNLDCCQDIHWLLENGDRRDNVVSAIEAAVARRMTDVISASLHHKFAHVQAIALNERAKTLEAPFPAEILGLIVAQGYPIRRAIVDLLAANPHPAHLDTLIELLADGYAERSHYGDKTEHPIARRAAEAIERGQYDITGYVDRLWIIAEECYDASLRFHIYWLVTATGDYDQQLAVLKVAVQGERRSIRHVASSALRMNWQKLDQRLVDLIKTVWLRRKWEPVAADFAVILGARGSDQVILEACESLAADRDRRVIVLAILAMVKERNWALATQIAAMLPSRNKAVPLVLSDSWNLISANSLEKLGGTAAVKAVMSLVAPSDS